MGGTITGREEPRRLVPVCGTTSCRVPEPTAPTRTPASAREEDAPVPRVAVPDGRWKFGTAVRGWLAVSGMKGERPVVESRVAPTERRPAARR